MRKTRVALTIVFDAAVWIFAIWAPIAWIIGLALIAREHRVILSVVGCVACGVAALVAYAMSRGIWSGRRIAYVFVCVMLLGAVGYHIRQALTTTSATAILAGSRAVAYVVLIGLVARDAMDR